MTPTIIFDFDGTLAVGHGPVLAYARFVSTAAKPGYLERVDAALSDFDAGATTYRDGYDVVGSLAALDGVSPETMAAAYANSREHLATELAPVNTMPGLDDFLAALHRDARLLLATNAPEAGVDRALGEWGVRDHFDELYFTVGKPAGLSAIVERAQTHGPVLAVGDIVEFDLAPALALGADTALVGATAELSPASVTMRGTSLSDLKEDIATWAADAAASAF